MIIFCAAICIKTQQFIIPYAGLGLMFNFAPASRVSSSFIGGAGNSKHISDSEPLGIYLEMCDYANSMHVVIVN